MGGALSPHIFRGRRTALRASPAQAQALPPTKEPRSTVRLQKSASCSSPLLQGPKSTQCSSPVPGLACWGLNNTRFPPAPFLSSLLLLTVYTRPSKSFLKDKDIACVANHLLLRNPTNNGISPAHLVASLLRPPPATTSSRYSGNTKTIARSFGYTT